MIPRSRLLRRLPCLFATLGAAIISVSAPARVRADSPSSIRLTPERKVIRADGIATTVISAQVYDDRGNAVPDGTRVRFYTTAGRFDASVVPTQSGIARATLTSADQPGIATIQVLLDAPGQSSPSVTTITFSNDVDAGAASNAWMHVDGDYTAYTTNFENLKVVQANGSGGKARLSYHGMVIHGDIIQVDLISNIATVRGNVKIVDDGVTREYRDLSFELTRGTGIGQRLVDGVLKTYTVAGSKLDEDVRPPGSPPLDPQLFAFQYMANGLLTVVATTIAVEPNTILQFKNATVYGNGYTLKFKNYSLGWDQKTVYSLPLVGYGPSGVMFDIPYDYDLQTSTRGTVHLRHGAQVGSSVYSVRPGWSLDAIQSYTGPQGIDGTAEIDGLGRDDWSAQLHHAQRLDSRTNLSLFLQAPSVSDLFATAQVTRNYQSFQLNLLGSGSRTGSVVDPTTGIRTTTSGEERAQITAQTFGKPVFQIQKLLYVLEAGISRQDSYSQVIQTTSNNTTKTTDDARLALRPGLGGSTTAITVPSQGVVDTQQLSSRFYTPALPIAPRLTLTQSVTVGQNWIEGSTAGTTGLAGSGISVLGTTTLARTFGPFGSGSIAYNYAQTPEILTSGIATAPINDNAHHRLSLSTSFGHGQAWSLTFSGSRGLDIDQSSLFTVLGFSLGGPTRGSVTLNNTNANGVHYSDIEYRLTRIMLGHGYSFYYSSTYRRIEFDTAAISF